MRTGIVVVACSLLALAGCSRQDTDKLARIGKTVSQQAEQSAGVVRQNLKTSVALPPVTSAAGRVQQRLQHDKPLRGAVIVVEDHGGGIELKGKVHDLEQRRRAVMLAETTVGVELVKDGLTMDDGSERRD